MRDAYTVFWRDFLILRKRFLRFFAGSMVGPLLYLTAFGWGLGMHVQMGETTYLNFVVPGILALSAMNGSFNATSVSLNMARLYHRTLEEFLVSPISVWSLVLGNVFGGVLRGFISAAIILLLAFLFGAHLNVLTPWFFAALFLTCFLFASLGVVAAMLINSHEDMARFSTFVILPMSFLCGTFFRLEKFPAFVAHFVQILPLTHSTLALRAAALGADFPFVSLAVLAGYAAFLFGLGIWATSRVE